MRKLGIALPWLVALVSLAVFTAITTLASSPVPTTQPAIAVVDTGIISEKTLIPAGVFIASVVIAIRVTWGIAKDWATLQTQVVQLQKELADLQLQLKEHDRESHGDQV